jgi:NADPH:quinone reductase-like Zn-dependent oxidoreductase
MKQVVIDRYGAPEDVAACAEVPDVGAPAAGEVVFDVPPLPDQSGGRLVLQGPLSPAGPARDTGRRVHRRVTAVGAGVSHVKPGDSSSTCSARTGPRSAASTPPT